MKNISHKKKWDAGTVKVHVEQPLISLIKSKNDQKSDKYCVKIKFCRYPMSQESELYEFKMSLFDNGDPEELLLFISNVHMILKASVTIAAVKNIQYLLTLVCGYALRHFGKFSTEVRITTQEILTSMILGLGT